MLKLHILNGDFSLELWKKYNFSTNWLVWKETYLEGPLPQSDDLHVFRSVRAEFLSTFEELSSIKVDALYKHLQRMDNALLELSESSELMLWFDACIFDQTILMRVLYLLNQNRTNLPKIYLYCCKSYCLTNEDFQKGYSEKVLLDCHDVGIAAKAWSAFVCKDATQMIELADSEDFAHMPAMRKALLRCAEDVPNANGLSRTERQILQILSIGKHSFEEIFQGLDAFEEYPFLGDSACKRILNNLVKKGLVCLVENNNYQLSSAYNSDVSEI